MTTLKLNYKARVQNTLCFVLLGFLLSSVSGCGFHLRGSFNIPPTLQTLKILPDQPYEPFQRILRPILKQNNITILDYCGPSNDCVSILQLSNLSFIERPVAYGRDVQVNRSTLQFKFTYEVLDANGAVIIPARCIEVERDFTIVPNAVLGTEHERNQVKIELYQDAATLLVRQLASICLTPH